MTNNDVVQQFERGLSGKSLNMESNGLKLWSYNTVVGQWIDGKLVKNITKYSQTTTKQTTHLDYDNVTKQHVPINTQDLTPYVSRPSETSEFNGEALLNSIRGLARSQGFYGRMLNSMYETHENEETIIMLLDELIEAEGLKTSLDFVMLVEG